MRTEVHVRFDAQERLIVQDARVHAAIACEVDSPELRALSTITSGGNVSHATLARAERGLAELVDACHEQAAPAWWRENVLAEPGAPGAVGLVADVDSFVASMAAVRARQLRDARAALTLVRMALAIAVPAPPEA